MTTSTICAMSLLIAGSRLLRRYMLRMAPHTVLGLLPSASDCARDHVLLR
jgi:hypothetical protein